jgi:hypothetical protein
MPKEQTEAGSPEIRGLSEALAKDLDESAEEIERHAEDFDIEEPWNAEQE